MLNVMEVIQLSSGVDFLEGGCHLAGQRVPSAVASKGPWPSHARKQ